MREQQTQATFQVSALNNFIVRVMLEMKYRLRTQRLISIHSLHFLQEVFTK